MFSDDRVIVDEIRSALLRTPGGSAARPHVFLEIAKSWKHRPDIIWRVLHLEWSGFDAIPYAKFYPLIKRIRRHWRVEYMPEADRKAFEALPEKIEIWRGQDENARIGLSWTTDREVAEQFARGHRWIFNPNPVVLCCVVDKDTVAMTPSDRREHEVVLFALPGP